MSEDDTESAPVEAQESGDSGEVTESESNGGDGTQYIDFDKLSPEVKSRFDRIYGNMKQYERTNDELIEQNRELRERLERVEVADTKRTTDQAVSRLREEKVRAQEEGDFARAAEIDDEILNLRSSTPRPQKQKPRQQPAQNGIDPNQAAELAAWTNETNEDGSLKRPWAQEGHPLYTTAAHLGADAIDRIGSLSEALKETDKLMAKLTAEEKKAVRNAPTNLPPDNDTPARPNGKVRLSDDQKMVAHRMYPNLGAKEAETRYLASVERLGV